MRAWETFKSLHFAKYEITNLKVTEHQMLIESAGSSSQQPVLNRDLQILIAEQIFTGICNGNAQYINDGFFNFFKAGSIVRSSVIAVLSKLTVFTLNDCRARLSSPKDNSKFLCIDFRDLSGYSYLEQLVKILNESGTKFFDVLHLVSLKGINIQELFAIFLMLKDLSVINFPYEFDSFSRNGEKKVMDKLIQKNANTLRSLHHLVHPFQLFQGFKNRIVAINSATLRTGTMERENDFYAFYTDPESCPKELMPPECGGISMGININRCKEVFRSVKRLHFRALQRDPLRSEITKLRLLSTYDFDVKTAQILLTQIERVRSTLPKVRSFGIELRTLEFNPSQAIYENGDFPALDDSDLVPPSASVCSGVALFFLEWLRQQKMGDMDIDGCVRLDVDFHCGKGKEADAVLLERAVRETISRSIDHSWIKQLEESVTVRNGCASAIAEIRVGDKLKFSFCIQFRAITFCEMPGHFERTLFHVVNSL